MLYIMLHKTCTTLHIYTRFYRVAHDKKHIYVQTKKVYYIRFDMLHLNDMYIYIYMHIYKTCITRSTRYYVLFTYILCMNDNTNICTCMCMFLCVSVLPFFVYMYTHCTTFLYIIYIYTYIIIFMYMNYCYCCCFIVNAI